MARNGRRSGFRLGFWLAAGFLVAASPAYAGDVSVKLDVGAGFAVKNNTGSTDRFRVDEATGNVSRNGALLVHTTGAHNMFMGPNTGNPATTGFGYNTGFGSSALAAVTSGAFNSAFGFAALNSNTTGFSNSAFGQSALQLNTTGGSNAAFGSQALITNSTGSSNTALGRGALFSNTSGSNNSAAGYGALHSNTTGGSNSAFGFIALNYNTTGYWNSAFGDGALRGDSTGPQNSAFGKSALYATTTGGSNSAFGSYALRANTTGFENAALGQTALRNNTSGADNTAVGRFALYGNTTGSRNIAIGSSAGSAQNTGNDNIYLANAGVAAESNTIRIGTSGTHTATFIAGINGTTVSGTGVLVTGSGQLGVLASSARFKEAVEDMGEASDRLMALRPVRFRYTRDAGGDGQTEEYGLIAEEVAEVAPELVIADAEGRPFSVKYHELPSLLLNEVKKQRRTIEAQQQEIAALTTRLAGIEARTSDATH